MFSDAFFVAYKAQDAAHPHFGAQTGISSEDWWRKVVRDTYDAVPHIDSEPGLREELEAEGEDTLFDAVFHTLHNEVFTTADGWELRAGVKLALENFSKWKASPGGPTHLGLISNFDERLHPLIENLGIAQHFDFILTSREAGESKPSRGLFDAALVKAGNCSPSEAVHIGDSFKNDVTGAADAGWHAIFIPSMEEIVSSPASSNAGPHAIEGASTPVEGTKFSQVGDLFGVLNMFGKAPEQRIISTTRHITEAGNFGMTDYTFD